MCPPKPCGGGRLHLSLEVQGQAQVPKSGSVILASTHRSRWEALIIPYVSGRRLSRRDLYYIFCHDEMLERSLLCLA
ncbi:hypothetical protein [Thermosynechococcus sp.]|uniref:hypothetical protein n=1 Tax=Thermosynechococcus sp. TaxID=2814275 RepID=UPI00391D252B